MELNKYFFEALRLRLENILRALSNNRKAHIVYSDSIATDVKNTVYLQPRDSIESGVKADLAELLIFYKARVSHEGAHIRFTSLKDWKEACSRGPVFQHLVNIIEDGRIESAIAGVLPGAGRWIKFTNQYVYNHRKPEAYGNGLQAFLMGLNVYSILQTVPSFLSHETQKLIKLAAPHVDIGRAASTTRQTLECAEQILSIPEIKALIDACTPPPMIEGDKGTKNPEQTTPSEETSERAKKAKEIIQRRKSPNESEEGQTTKEKRSSKEHEAEKSNKEKTEDTSDDNNTDDNCSKDNNQEAEESNDSNNEFTDSESPEQSVDNKDQSADSKSAQQNSENNTDSEHNSVSDDNDEDANDFSDDEDTQNNLSDDDTEDTHQDNPSDDEKNTSEDIPDKTSDKDPEESLADDASDKDSDDSLEDPNDSSDSNTEGLEDGLEGSENLEAASQDNNSSTSGSASGEPGSPGDPGDEEDFFSNPPEENFEELLEDTSEEVLSLTKDAENFAEEEKPLDILEGIPLNIHGGVKLKQIIPKPRLTEYQTLKKRNATLIKNLVNEIQVALETRKAYDLRSLNRGKLHSGSLWKLAVPDPSVFSRRVIPGDIPELAVYILVDLSGSMTNANTLRGPTRINSVKNAACVLSEACRELKIVHSVTGFNNQSNPTHYNAVTWEDSESSKISSFEAKGDNRDGFSIRVAANELSFRPEPKKVLFVLSDGQPNSDNYQGLIAHGDVKQAVFEAKKKGLQVISIYFGDDQHIFDFKFMYDTPVFVPDLTILPRALGEVFKRVLLDY